MPALKKQNNKRPNTAQPEQVLSSLPRRHFAHHPVTTKRNQLRGMIGPRLLLIRVTSFSGRQPNAMWRLRARMPHTHGALMTRFQTQSFPSFLGRSDSLCGSSVICRLFRMSFPPRLGDPAPFVEESPDNDHIEVEDTPGHPDPVNFDVGGEVLPSSDSVLVDRPVVGDDLGTITPFATFFSLVSVVVHCLYLSSISLNALFKSSVDVTFTSTTTFRHSSPGSLLNHTRSGFSFAPAT